MNTAGEQPEEQAAALALDAISERLHHMLNLAILSAADGLTVDRAVLQKRLEVLRAEIDRIADTLPAGGADTGGVPSEPETSTHTQKR